MEAPMTVNELSEYLKLDRMTIYKMLREGTIGASRIGHQWRFFKQDVDEWLRAMRVGQRNVALVVDSDQGTREIVEAELRAQDFDVLTASSVDEALDIAAQHQLDLAFVEFNRTAIRAVRRLREADSDLPVVLMGDSVSSQLIDRIMEIGIFILMRRPSSREQVAAAVPNLVS